MQNSEYVKFEDIKCKYILLYFFKQILLTLSGGLNPHGSMEVVQR